MVIGSRAASRRPVGMLVGMLVGMEEKQKRIDAAGCTALRSAPVECF